MHSNIENDLPCSHAGNVAVLPVGTGQDSVILKNVADNSYVPLQVQRVLDSGTTAADILGLE